MHKGVFFNKDHKEMSSDLHIMVNFPLDMSCALSLYDIGIFGEFMEIGDFINKEKRLVFDSVVNRKNTSLSTEIHDIGWRFLYLSSLP